MFGKKTGAASAFGGFAQKAMSAVRPQTNIARGFTAEPGFHKLPNGQSFVNDGVLRNPGSYQEDDFSFPNATPQHKGYNQNAVFTRQPDNSVYLRGAVLPRGMQEDDFDFYPEDKQVVSPTFQDTGNYLKRLLGF